MIRRKSVFLPVFLLAVLLLTLASVPAVAQEDTHYVAFVPPALTSPFHVAMVEGATARAEELGWTLEVQAPASKGCRRRPGGSARECRPAQRRTGRPMRRRHHSRPYRPERVPQRSGVA